IPGGPDSRGAGRDAAGSGDRPEQARSHRAAHREDRSARYGRDPDGAGHRPVPQGPESYARRPQGRARGGRHRLNPAGTKTKTQELVERDHVDMIFGPLAAFELLAISDYTTQAKM